MTGSRTPASGTHSTIKARLVCAYFGFPFNQKSIRQFPNEYSVKEPGCQTDSTQHYFLCVFQFRVIQGIETEQVDEEGRIPFSFPRCVPLNVSSNPDEAYSPFQMLKAFSM